MTSKRHSTTVVIENDAYESFDQRQTAACTNNVYEIENDMYEPYNPDRAAPANTNNGNAGTGGDYDKISLPTDRTISEADDIYDKLSFHFDGADNKDQMKKGDGEGQD